MNCVTAFKKRNLRVHSGCLAKHTDDLWQLATIEHIDGDNGVSIRFKKFNLVKTLTWENVYPLDNPHDDNTSDLSSLSSGILSYLLNLEFLL